MRDGRNKRSGRREVGKGVKGKGEEMRKTRKQTENKRARGKKIYEGKRNSMEKKVEKKWRLQE